MGAPRFFMLTKSGQNHCQFTACFATSWPSLLLLNQPGKGQQWTLASVCQPAGKCNPALPGLRLALLPLTGVEMWIFLLHVCAGFHKS